MWTDLSIPLDDTFPAWPGSNACQISRHYQGDCVSSTLTTNVHIATHIDAPLHFIPGGETIDQISIEQLCGTVQVIEIPDSVIEPKHLSGLSCSKVIFKTMNEITPTFTDKYCYLSPLAAENLVQSGIDLVGTDYLSIENYNDKNFTTHKILLGNGVIIIEALNTNVIYAGYYEMIALPILMPSEASPARVIVKRLENPS